MRRAAFALAFAAGSAASASFGGEAGDGDDAGAVLFVTSEDSWNEEQPFITKKGVPGSAIPMVVNGAPNRSGSASRR